MALGPEENLITLTADIVSAHVENNQVAVGDVPGLISKVYSALAALGSPPAPPAVPQEPAVSIRSSVKPDHIVCLEDGQKQKMLKRHLSTAHGMSPADYRAKWKLPADYPMVAPNYAEQRRQLAHEIGLGRKSIAASAPAPEPTGAKPQKRSIRKLKLS
jgi:predicted transcriptional regulator